MEFSAELLFFFSALGAFNGLLLGCYFLFFAQPKHLSNRFLGLFLLSLSIRIGKSVFYYFKPDLAYDYLQLGLSACLFVGPFFYLYFQSTTQPLAEIKRKWPLHIVPYIVIAVLLAIFYPFEAYPDGWRYYVISIIYTQWLLYTITVSFSMQNILHSFRASEDKWRSREFWLISIFWGNLLIWMAYNYCGYRSYILGALSFSFMLYLLLLLLLFNKKKNPYFSKVKEKPLPTKIESTEAAVLLAKLNQLMETEELYKNANLKLQDVAKQIPLQSHRLSQLLNDNLGKSFPSFLNEYRVAAAKTMIKEKDDFSLEAIGYECGFNSKSTFYATFKKYTATTPAKYKQGLTDSRPQS